MLGLKKKQKEPKVVYQIKGEEKGQFQAFNAIAALSSASATQLLSKIIEREGIPTADEAGVVFDPQLMAFVQK